MYPRWVQFTFTKETLKCFDVVMRTHDWLFAIVILYHILYTLFAASTEIESTCRPISADSKQLLREAEESRDSEIPSVTEIKLEAADEVVTTDAPAADKEQG